MESILAYSLAISLPLAFCVTPAFIGLILCLKQCHTPPNSNDAQISPETSQDVEAPSTQPYHQPLSQFINFMSQTRSGEDDSSASSDTQKCCVCLSRRREVAIIPCGHYCLCKSDECANDRLRNCPICRNSIASFIVIY